MPPERRDGGAAGQAFCSHVRWESVQRVLLAMVVGPGDPALERVHGATYRRGTSGPRTVGPSAASGPSLPPPLASDPLLVRGDGKHVGGSRSVATTTHCLYRTCTWAGGASVSRARWRSEIVTCSPPVSTVPASAASASRGTERPLSPGPGDTGRVADEHAHVAHGAGPDTQCRRTGAAWPRVVPSRRMGRGSSGDGWVEAA